MNLSQPMTSRRVFAQHGGERACATGRRPIVLALIGLLIVLFGPLLLVILDKNAPDVTPVATINSQTQGADAQ